MSKRKNIQTERFEKDFEEIFDYIHKESIQNAKNFAKELDIKIDFIKHNPHSIYTGTIFTYKTQLISLYYCYEILENGL